MRTSFVRWISSSLLLIVHLFANPVVERVDFTGLKRTDRAYLEANIQTRIQAPVDSTVLEADVQALRNLRVFSDVNYIVRDSSGLLIVEFHVKEVATVLPTANFGGIEGNYRFKVGMKDFHLLGRGNTGELFYRYYDRHSFEGNLTVPRLFAGKAGFFLCLQKLSTTEPTYIQGEKVSYDVDRWGATLLPRYNLSPACWFELGGGFLHEKYAKNLQESPAASPGPDLKEFDKYLIKGISTYDGLDYFFEFLSGNHNELVLELVGTKGEESLFWKIVNIWKWYTRAGESGNVALRLRTGIAENKESPFVPFVLDSYLTVRGSGNRVARGTAEVTMNCEYRHTLAKPGWGAIQGVGFLDWSAWRTAGGGYSDLLSRDFAATFLGVGFRVYFQHFYHLVLRLDYGHSVTNSDQHGIVFGTGHYF